jgi:hypothetical protein
MYFSQELKYIKQKKDKKLIIKNGDKEKDKLLTMRL